MKITYLGLTLGGELFLSSFRSFLFSIFIDEILLLIIF